MNQQLCEKPEKAQKCAVLGKLQKHQTIQRRFGTNRITLPETNVAPENRPSQKETSIPTIHFQVLC